MIDAQIPVRRGINIQSTPAIARLKPLDGSRAATTEVAKRCIYANFDNT